MKFSVSDTLGVIVHARGELRRNENRYDYGWLVNDATDEKVWAMSWQASYPGGGHSGNREQTAFLRLVPGTYTLHYQTDDSHAYGSWTNGTPDNPDHLAWIDIQGDVIQDLRAIMTVTKRHAFKCHLALDTGQ